jgi:hypothetical protein
MLLSFLTRLFKPSRLLNIRQKSQKLKPKSENELINDLLKIIDKSDKKKVRKTREHEGLKPSNLTIENVRKIPSAPFTQRYPYGMK